MFHRRVLSYALVAELAAVAGCDRKASAPSPVPATAPVAAPTAPSAAPAAPNAAPAAPKAATATPPVTGSTESGPPAITRMVPGEQAATAGPFTRGDYLIALDYRPEGYGTYGFLYHGDGRIWFVENDEVVGGPFAETSPEFQQVVARWTAAERQRHRTVMRGIEALPKGCLDGCAFSEYQNGAYIGTRIKY